jgi:hypothetical protein
MPNYDMRNKETGEIVEYTMSYTKLDQFLVDNPQLERFHSAAHLPVMSDGARMSVPGIGQPDARFEREIIGRIKEKVPGNTLAQGHKTKMPREW